MRFIIALLLLTSSQAFATDASDARDFANQNSCPVPSDEQLICEALMCNPIGMAIADSRSECIRVNRRLVIYLATLGFWEDPPKCKSRDSNCNKTGNATRGNNDDGTVVYRDANGDFRDSAGNLVYSPGGDDDNPPDCDPRKGDCDCDPRDRFCDDPLKAKKATSSLAVKPLTKSDKDTSSLSDLAADDSQKLNDIIDNKN